jgi:hypothetical protein
MKKFISQAKLSLIIWSSLLAYQLAFPKQAQGQTTKWEGVCVSEDNTDVATIQGLRVCWPMLS